MLRHSSVCHRLSCAFTTAFLLFTSQPASAGLVDQFNITLKQTVSLDNPGPGAGNIEVVGATDLYSFTVDPGTQVYFEELSGPCNVNWKCEKPGGTVLFTNNPLCVGDPGTHTLAEGGEYLITVFSTVGGVGTYSFKLWQVNPPELFDIDIKQTVSSGVPLPGAGNLEEPGAIDQYFFEVDAGMNIYFDELSGNCAMVWECKSPSGAVIFTNNAICVGDPGAFVLEEAGKYTITVHSGMNGVVGPYSFKLWEVNDPEVFDITLKQTVSNGSPKPGAGNIEEPGATDVYTFTAELGTLVYFDELSGSNCAVVWQCAAPDDTILFTNNAVCVGDPGAFLIDQQGEYTITVSGNFGATGTYSFVLVAVNPVQSFEIELEQTVSNGQPARGAGNIEEPGAIDEYTLNVAAGTLVYFDSLVGPCQLQWKCTAPDESIVFANAPMCTNDPATKLLTQSGDYTITVSGTLGGVGTYSFIVWEVNPPETFFINIDEVVMQDVPGAGAGFIEEPGAIDRYILTANAGDLICFEQLGGSCGFKWECRDPNGELLWNDPAFCVAPPGKFTLPFTGDYVISHSGVTDAIGPYSFIVNTGRAADINGNCQVDVDDLLIVINEWGACPTPPETCIADIAPFGGNGTVDVDDLLMVINDWG